jgi:hypothetical protein
MFASPSTLPRLARRRFGLDRIAALELVPERARFTPTAGREERSAHAARFLRIERRRPDVERVVPAQDNAAELRIP